MNLIKKRSMPELCRMCFEVLRRLQPAPNIEMPECRMCRSAFARARAHILRVRDFCDFFNGVNFFPTREENISGTSGTPALVYKSISYSAGGTLKTSGTTPASYLQGVL